MEVDSGRRAPSYKPKVKKMLITTTFKDSATSRTYRIGSTVYLADDIAKRATEAGYAKEVIE